MLDRRENPLCIGYLVPTFPAQTHAFFWREILHLQKLGIEPRLLSTRPPNPGLICHGWAEHAKRSTLYLYPLTPRDLLAGMVFFLRAGPKAWLATIRLIFAGGIKRAPRQAILAAMASKLVSAAANEGWSHLHVHSCADSALIAVFASQLSRISYGLTLHGALSGYGPLQAVKWRGAAYGITVSQLLRAELLTHLEPHVKPSISVAPMGVDLTVFSRRTTYIPWSSPNRLKLFSCARLHPGKGHEDLVEAVRLLIEDGWNISLRIGGQDESGGTGYALTLQSVIRQKCLSDSIVLLGPLSEQQVISELETTQIFVLASHDEAIGVAYMEAMAMGVPTVGTNVGGVSELITDGEDGVLVERMKPSQLASAIGKLAKAPELAHKLSGAGRKKVENEFQATRSALLISELVNRVINEPVET